MCNCKRNETSINVCKVYIIKCSMSDDILLMCQYVGILHLVLSMFLNLYVTTIVISYTVLLRRYCAFAILWALHMVYMYK